MDPVSVVTPETASGPPATLPFEPLPAFRGELLANDAELADNRGNVKVEVIEE